MNSATEISIALFFTCMCALFYASGRWDNLRNNLKRHFDLMLPDEQQEVTTKIAVSCTSGLQRDRINKSAGRAVI